MSIVKTIFNFFFHPDKIAWKGVGPARWLYAVIAVITFGHIGSQHPTYEKIWVACAEDQPKYITRCYDYGNELHVGRTVSDAVFGGVLWPLYLSWHIQSSAK